MFGHHRSHRSVLECWTPSRETDPAWATLDSNVRADGWCLPCPTSRTYPARLFPARPRAPAGEAVPLPHALTGEAVPLPSLCLAACLRYSPPSSPDHPLQRGSKMGEKVRERDWGRWWIWHVCPIVSESSLHSRLGLQLSRCAKQGQGLK
jgi:hypothetical protein